MAEDSPPPSEDQQSRGRSLNPGRSQQINRVEVTRMDVQTGEIKELQTDLLSEICDCIDEQTITLAKKLDQLQRELVKAMERQRKDRGKDRAGNKEAERMKKFGDSIRDSTETVKDGKKETKGFVGGLQKAISGLDEFRFSTILVAGAVTKMFHTFTENLELTKTSLFDLTDSFTDTGALLREDRLTTIESFKAMREAIDRGAAPAIGVLGDTLQEVGFELVQFQKRASEAGFDFAQSMDFREMSAATIQMLDLQRRAGIQGGIRDSSAEKSVFAQLTALRSISAFTGKTSDEIVKLTAEESRTFAELAASGSLNAQQVELFTGLHNFFKASGATNMATLMTEVADKGNIFLAAQQNDGIRQLIAQFPEIVTWFERLQNDTSMLTDFRSDDVGFFQNQLGMLKQIDITFASGAQRSKLDAENFAGALEAQLRAITDNPQAIADAIAKERFEDPISTGLDEMIRIAQMQFENNVPQLIRDGFKVVGSLLIKILEKVGGGAAGAAVGGAAGGAAGAAAAGAGGTGIMASLKGFGGKMLSGVKSLGGKGISLGGKLLTRVVAPISAGLAGVELGKWMEEQFGVGSFIGRIPELFGLDESIGTAIFELEQMVRKGVGAEGGAGITDALEASRAAFGNIYEWIGAPTGVDKEVSPVGPPSNKPAVTSAEKANQELLAPLDKMVTMNEKMIGLMETNNIQNDAAKKAFEAGDAKVGMLAMTKTLRERGMTTEAISQLFSQTISQ